MFAYLLSGVTEENRDDVSSEINKIGRLISAPGLFMALVFSGDEESASNLLQPTLDLYKLTTIKANIS